MVKKKIVKNDLSFETFNFSREELIALDSLIEDNMLRLSHLKILLHGSKDSFRYYHVQKKFDLLLNLSVKLEFVIKNAF